jgi:hypothetical protein
MSDFYDPQAEGDFSKRQQLYQHFYHPYGHVGPYTPPPAQQKLMEMPPMDAAMANNFYQGRLRNLHAQARGMETKVLLDGMEEIRMALAQGSISDGDKGGDVRPPLEAGFDELNRGRLQNAYLRLAERFVNYVDHTLEKQLEMPLTNEIKK